MERKDRKIAVIQLDGKTAVIWDCINHYSISVYDVEVDLLAGEGIENVDADEITIDSHSFQTIRDCLVWLLTR